MANFVRERRGEKDGQDLDRPANDRKPRVQSVLEREPKLAGDRHFHGHFQEMAEGSGHQQGSEQYRDELPNPKGHPLRIDSVFGGFSLRVHLPPWSPSTPPNQ